MAQAEASVPAKARHLPRMGRLGWFFSSILIGLAVLFAGYVALILGYREQLVFNGQVMTVPDRVVSLWISIAALVPLALIGIMRRHDRDKSGWDVTAITLFNVAVSGAGTFGVLAVPYLALPIIAALLVANIYSLIVLLFLPGDKGANRYGWRDGHPETGTVPLASATTASSASPISSRSPLERTPKPTVTLTEQANGQRIPRSMFIGHTAGYLLILALAIIALTFVPGMTVPTSYDAVFTVTTPPMVLHYPYTGLHPYAVIGLSVIAMLVWTDLTLRRRHDRGRSGVDAAIFQILLLASVIIHTFGNAPDIVGYLDAFLVLFGLYLFVVLVILPGNAHENRYGAVPKPD